ncbi:HAD-IB family hydrolase [Sulfurimonas aquatica]|uniref:HAD-IB family hydrolase n=1 Tax=Sulfurimonas aquatica TaxID=2672570 RepID=A0A975B037_9BACT|nr:HAD family hydrolase [Sulfurimonas aquatica]QSZ41680.1 HAD-IB family hydrolase [Sulfurimonas aquatica]
MKLALFDFDGTLTTKDSLEEFIIFAVGKRHYYFKLIFFSPIFLLYKLKIMHNSYAKELLFRLFFHKIKESDFKALASSFSAEILNAILREDIYKKFQEHKLNGDRVIVVSASMRCWLEPWTKLESVELLSTELEFKDGEFSGRFSTLNCHGQEKLNRIQKHLNLDDYEEIYAYGDSSGDTQMLSIADKSIKV